MERRPVCATQTEEKYREAPTAALQRKYLDGIGWMSLDNTAAIRPRQCCKSIPQYRPLPDRPPFSVPVDVLVFAFPKVELPAREGSVLLCGKAVLSQHIKRRQVFM